MGYDFHRQKPIDNYIADFFSTALMLAIELDGYTHGFEDVFERDKKKEQRLNEIGIMTLAFGVPNLLHLYTKLFISAGIEKIITTVYYK